MSVVLVDDTPDIRLLLRLLVDGHDRFEVVGEAENGAEAMKIVDRLKPDLVVLDLAMPKMDGFEVLGEMCAVSPDTSVVVLSGFEESIAASKALEAGAAAYFEKGSDMQGLVQVLVALSSADGA
ncbi:MAG: response regulator transcription factor [Actinomycetota bacterium]